MAHYELGFRWNLKRGKRLGMRANIIGYSPRSVRKTDILYCRAQTGAGRLRGDLSGEMQITDLDYKELKMIEKTQLQELIIEIWSELLDLDSVGPEDEFLSLGGNSVQAMQFISRFREACGLDVTQEMLFTHGSPSSIASAVTDPT